MAERPDIIYALIDPRTEEIRYVGKTNQTLKARLNAHLQDRSKCHRCNWIATLSSLGMKPKIAILEACGRWPWQETERFWIRSLKLAGYRLTNNTSGGDGVCDLPEETRQRMRLVWLGRKHSPETLAKLKLRDLGKKASASTRLKMSIAQKGRKITWTEKIAESNRKLNADQVSEIQQRLNSGEMVISISKELKIHRTTISKVKLGTYFEPYRKSKL